MSEPQYVTIAWDDGGGQTYSIRIDATVAESHTFANTVTDHPVERGANITDHVRPNPARIAITGVVSNSPFVLPADHISPGIEQVDRLVDVRINPSVRAFPMVNATAPFTGEAPDIAILTRVSPGYAATAKVLAFSSPFDRVRSVFDALTSLRERGTLLRVITALRDYEDMVIENLVVPRDASTGDTLVFDISLKHVITADIMRVALAKNKGARTKKPITEPEEEQASGTVLTWLKDQLQ